LIFNRKVHKECTQSAQRNCVLFSKTIFQTKNHADRTHTQLRNEKMQVHRKSSIETHQETH